MKRVLNLAVLSVILVAVSTAAFYSQTEKRHMMAAKFFENIATSLSSRIDPGMERLADLESLLGLGQFPISEWTREASELVAMERALRTEANVLRMWAEDDLEGVEQYQEEWYGDDIQVAIKRGIYPGELERLISDHTVYLEFIRIRNQYIDPETNRWKLKA